MHRRAIALALGIPLLATAAARAGPAPASAPPGPFRAVRVVDFEGEIEPVLAAYVRRQVEAAEDAGADALVLRIDSPGGRVDSSQAIGDLLVGLPDSIRTIAWVPERAYSGAAMVALACDEIVMSESAHLGDAQPILILPEGPGYRPAGEKMESPLRAKFREYATKNGYPVLLAEAMVSADIEVLRVRAPDGSLHFVRGKEFREAAPEAEVVAGVAKRDLVQVGDPVVAEGHLLTMTASEARDLGFLRRRFGDGAAFPRDEEALLAAVSAPGASVLRVGMSASERAARFLAGTLPFLGAIVSLAVVLLLFQGPGVFTIVGAVALALIGLITLTAEQLHGFPVFLCLLGAGLLAAEVFLLPGFGIAGILGIAALFAGFLLLAAGVSLGDPGDLSGDLVLDFAWKFLLTLLGGLVGIWVLARTVPGLVFGRRMLLAPPAPSPAGGAPRAADLPAPGERGRTSTPLRPAGTAEFAGRLVDVVSETGFLEAGVPVRVVAVEGPAIVVRAERAAPARRP